MANWMAVLDPDQARRARFVAATAGVLAPVDGLSRGTAQCGIWTAVWAAAPAAPVDVVASDADACVLWGDALDEAGARQTAASVALAWRGGASSQWDGYHSAVAVEAGPEPLFTAGADVLGIFPIYWWTDGSGVVLAGTSPELFAAHPCFRPDLDVSGLAGILLTNGLVDGRTLWKGVRRLPAGYRLRVAGRRVWEEEAYRVPCGLGGVDLPLAGHVRQLAHAIADAVVRHVPAGRPYGLLLSGGLDSRMVAGFLHRAGIRPRALTLGLPTDLEMRCAQAVARTYGLDHVTAEPQAADYPVYAGIQARWEHLANGFNTVRDWWTRGQVAALGDRLVTGGLSDAVVGGTAMPWAYTDEGPAMTYEAFVANMPRMAVPPDVARQLLARTGQDGVVEAVAALLRAEFDSYGERRSHAAWRYDLAHGQRYHVGSTAWRLSFGAWPVLPMLDRRVIEVAANIPAASLADREAQLALVRTALPELAGVPLDRSDLMSDEPQYLTPRLRHLLASWARGRARSVGQALRLPARGEDARYWFRINNLNGDAWVRVRAAAEPHRDRVSGVLDPDLLRVILPPPPARAGAEGPRVPESGRKLLLGFVHWAADHLTR
jgi:asparagine synthase (glutamine-hydrolysing)